MKKFFTAALLSFALFAAPAYFAQTKGTEVPQNKVVATAKPFIGKWAAVSVRILALLVFDFRFALIRLLIKRTGRVGLRYLN